MAIHTSAVIAFFAGSYGPKCLNCRGVADPTHCTDTTDSWASQVILTVQSATLAMSRISMDAVDTTDCWASQECYAEYIQHGNGSSWYNFGCKIQEECRLIESAGVYFRRSFEPVVTACHKCCDSDFCNVAQCNNVTASLTSCFSCKDQDDTLRCQTLKHCDPHETCFAEAVIEDSPIPKYSLGCIGRTLCEYLAPLVGRRSSGRDKRRSHICQKCCYTPGCNIDICSQHQGPVTPALETSTATLTVTSHEPDTTSNVHQSTTEMSSSTTHEQQTTCTSDLVSQCSIFDMVYLGSHSLSGGKDVFGPNFIGKLTGGQVKYSKNDHARMIRLVNGRTRVEGRVEVLHSGSWGTVCDDNFNANAAKAVCRQLGLPSEDASALPSSYFGEGTGRIWLDDVNCGGNESSLFDCRHAGWGVNNCHHNEDVGVRCINTDVNDSVRLVNGANALEGRVEINHNNQWGTICDDLFYTNAATVICRMLGFHGRTHIVKPSAFFGPGNGTIWLDDVRCTGQESSITQCIHGPWGQSNCRHTEDVGVLCSSV